MCRLEECSCKHECSEIQDRQSETWKKLRTRAVLYRDCFRGGMDEGVTTTNKEQRKSHLQCASNVNDECHVGIYIILHNDGITSRKTAESRRVTRTQTAGALHFTLAAKVAGTMLAPALERQQEHFAQDASPRQRRAGRQHQEERTNHPLCQSPCGGGGGHTMLLRL